MPQRGDRMSAEAAGLYLDYSKQRVSDETLRLLLELADACDLRGRIAAMFRGERINRTEDRAVLHVALRAPAGERIEVDGVDVVAAGARKCWTAWRLSPTACAAANGPGTAASPCATWSASASAVPTSGPVMAYEALRDYSQRDLDFRFVSNVDPTDFVEAVRDLDPAETLFIVCSKTFTTLETLTNAHAARAWCLQALGERGRRRSRNTSSPSRPTPKACANSASIPTTCSGSGIGSAAAIRWIRRSACRP